MSKTKQTAIGVSLAFLVMTSWLTIHLVSIFWIRLNPTSLFTAVPFILLQTWLGAGLFIIAHDSIHGSLAPGRARLNQCIGGAALGLYAFFPYRVVADKHRAHHAHSGHQGDPDFYADRPMAFWAWYANFMREYFGMRQFLGILTTVLIYVLFLHANVLNVIIFWATPSILSSLQLFMFGTWLPHRHPSDDFLDRHNARSIDYSWLGSLAACYHFGYHIDHHRSPHAPWWALPAVRAQRLTREASFQPQTVAARSISVEQTPLL